MAVVITRAQWKKFAPKCPANYTEALFNNMVELENAGILENELRWCHFIATCYAEMDAAGGFREIREIMNYKTVGALRGAWPSRFNHLSNEECKTYLRNPVVLAEKVYGLQSGRAASLGNVNPGDAFAFRGGGWFNTTGRKAVEEYRKKLGMPLPALPEDLDDPVLTLKFACFEWAETNCNKWADENEIIRVAKAINTGSAMSGVRPNGMDIRKEGFERAWKIWGETGDADKPAKEISIMAIAAKVGVPAAGTAMAAPTVVSYIPTIPEPAVIKEYVGVFGAIKDFAVTSHFDIVLAYTLPFLPYAFGAGILYAGLSWWSKRS